MLRSTYWIRLGISGYPLWNDLDHYWGQKNLSRTSWLITRTRVFKHQKHCHYNDPRMFKPHTAGLRHHSFRCSRRMFWSWTGVVTDPLRLLSRLLRLLIVEKLPFTDAASCWIDMVAHNMPLALSLLICDTRDILRWQIWRIRVWPFIDPITRNSCVVITAFKQRLVMLHLCKRWIILTKKKLSLTVI